MTFFLIFFNKTMKKPHENHVCPVVTFLGYTHPVNRSSGKIPPLVNQPLIRRCISLLFKGDYPWIFISSWNSRGISELGVFRSSEVNWRLEKATASLELFSLSDESYEPTFLISVVFCGDGIHERELLYTSSLAMAAQLKIRKLILFLSRDSE